MIKREKKDIFIPFLLILADIIGIELSFIFSYWIRFYSPLKNNFEFVSSIPPLFPYIYGSLFIIPIWLILFNIRKMYSSGRILSISEEFIPVIKVVTTGMFVLLSVAFFYRDFSYSRIVFVLIFFNSIVFILICRGIVLKIEKFIYKRGMQLKNVLIIGANQNARKIYIDLLKSKDYGLNLTGYCSDEKIENSDFKHLGQINELRKIILEKNIEIVMAALSTNDHNLLFSLIEQCEGLNIEFMFMPDILELMNNRIRVKVIKGIPFLRLKGIPISGWNRLLKRSFDLVFSILFLVFSLPVSLFISLLIKLESRGPLFYSQERVGLEGIIFKLIKFRSMRIDSEDRSGPVWAKENDARTTKIGKFIRKYSIDEIPQFINVLKGDMSVVGPRPERPFFVEQFKEKIPKYLERHRVKTGLTGWAQVNGLRGNTPLDERIRFDIYYIENWSLLLDIMIIIKTFREVFFSKNAY
jgi:exopolysaccharide biosynthesis polyprenyl glycosylphosphotransferase